MNAVSTHADRMIRTLAGLGFQLATPRDIVAGRAAAAALVGGEIASAEVMLRVQARSRCAVFSARAADGALVAAVSALPLTCLGAGPVGRLDGIRPDPRLIARPTEQPCAVYLWGAAGFTWRGRRLALAACLAIQREACPHPAALCPGGHRRRRPRPAPDPGRQPPGPRAAGRARLDRPPEGRLR